MHSRFLCLIFSASSQQESILITGRFCVAYFIIKRVYHSCRSFKMIISHGMQTLVEYHVTLHVTNSICPWSINRFDLGRRRKRKAEIPQSELQKGKHFHFRLDQARFSAHEVNLSSNVSTLIDFKEEVPRNLFKFSEKVLAEWLVFWILRRLI